MPVRGELINKHLIVEPIVWDMTWEVMKKDDQLKIFNDEMEPIEEVVMLDNMESEKICHFDKKYGNITSSADVLSVEKLNTVPQQAGPQNKECQLYPKNDNTSTKFTNAPKNSRISVKNSRALTQKGVEYQDKESNMYFVHFDALGKEEKRGLDLMLPKKEKDGMLCQYLLPISRDTYGITQVF